jgi:hypothetical protein
LSIVGSGERPADYRAGRKAKTNADTGAVVASSIAASIAASINAITASIAASATILNCGQEFVAIVYINDAIGARKLRRRRQSTHDSQSCSECGGEQAAKYQFSHCFLQKQEHGDFAECAY